MRAHRNLFHITSFWQTAFQNNFGASSHIPKSALKTTLQPSAEALYLAFSTWALAPWEFWASIQDQYPGICTGRCGSVKSLGLKTPPEMSSDCASFIGKTIKLLLQFRFLWVAVELLAKSNLPALWLPLHCSRVLGLQGQRFMPGLTNNTALVLSLSSVGLACSEWKRLWTIQLLFNWLMLWIHFFCNLEVLCTHIWPFLLF